MSENETAHLRVPVGSCQERAAQPASAVFDGDYGPLTVQVLIATYVASHHLSVL